jgi:phosphoenolpyruvate synthase/pyruvate phosphate dikinase
MKAHHADDVVIDLTAVGRIHVPLVGGKGANLGELTRLDGVDVPAGFCVTTTAFDAVAAAAGLDEQLARLDTAAGDDPTIFGTLAADVRAALESAPVPHAIATAVSDALERLGADRVAVRSSATAEDAPAASFAGQHDSYLDVEPADVLDHVRRCWASLFTDRAVAYRVGARIDNGSVRMAVVVQQMVHADAAGVIFTADPATSNRRTVVVEAVPGLGDALVAGHANTLTHRVRGDVVVDSVVDSAVDADDADDRAVRLLDDDLVVRLARLGRRIEQHFGCPQDIEWCLTGSQIHVVQARPITTLFPVPIVDDDANHVYVSVGHNQMMTDPMTPLGLSVWQMTTPAPMVEAGSRLFVDVTSRLATSSGRTALLELFGRGDPLMRDALATVLERDDFVPTAPDDDTAPAGPLPPADDPIDTDPEIVTTLIEATRTSIEIAASRLARTPDVDVFDVIAADLGELRARLFDPTSHRATMAGIEATWWLNDHLAEWLDEPNAADVLTRSAPNNVTSEMGLALLDLADVIRPHDDVVGRLRRAAEHDDDGFLDGLDTLDGGREARVAIERYLDRYGMRCIGEIDIGRTRWAEQPSTLLPTLLADVDHFEPGEAHRRSEAGRNAADSAAHRLLERLRALPDGERKADRTEVMIDRLRTFIGYREYPKYGMIARYWLYKQAVSRTADRLVRDGVIATHDDVYFLRFDELRDVARTGCADGELIARRRSEHRRHKALVPPRVTTSDGDAHNGRYRRDGIPPGSLAGLGVSGGVVRGPARVITDIAGARLEPGDILVTTHTDPSWSPLFVTAAGLVTEVGGLMTHGAVVAREYGLPAVVAVAGATDRISDGQVIEIDGTNGLVRFPAPRRSP